MQSSFALKQRPGRGMPAQLLLVQTGLSPPMHAAEASGQPATVPAIHCLLSCPVCCCHIHKQSGLDTSVTLPGACRDDSQSSGCVSAAAPPSIPQHEWNIFFKCPLQTMLERVVCVSQSEVAVTTSDIDSHLAILQELLVCQNWHNRWISTNWRYSIEKNLPWPRPRTLHPPPASERLHAL